MSKPLPISGARWRIREPDAGSGAAEHRPSPAGGDGSPPADHAAAAPVPPRIKRAAPTSPDAARLSQRPVVPADRSANAKGKTFRDRLKQIEDKDWEMYAAVSSPPARQSLFEVRRALAARTNCERDDERLLMQIGSRLRQGGPDFSVARAARAVVATLPTLGDSGNGDATVVLPDGRDIARHSAEKHLQQKFHKHRPRIMRRIDGIALGRQVAQRHLAPLLASPDGVMTFRLPAVPTSSVRIAPRLLERGAALLDSVSLPDAVDAFLREARKMQ